MTNDEFREKIKSWKLQISHAGIVLPDGEHLPDKFFHVLLGVGYSTFKKMLSGQDSMRPIQPYTAKHVRVLSKLDTNVFLDEVRQTIPEYLEQYACTRSTR